MERSQPLPHTPRTIAAPWTLAVRGNGSLVGVPAFGEPGVFAVLNILQREFETIMRQAGATELRQITAVTVAIGPRFSLR